MNSLNFLVKQLKEREYGQDLFVARKSGNYKKLASSIKFEIIYDYVDQLQSLLAMGKIAPLDDLLSSIMSELDCINTNPARVNTNSNNKKQIFVKLGGFEMVLRLLHAPFGIGCRDADANKYGVFSSFFLILRSLIVQFKELSDTITNESLYQMMQFLKIDSTFTVASAAIEEVLAFRFASINLHLVPNIREIVENFNVYHFCHFTRILSLLLFEPEDRFILQENNQLLSFMLLRVRRDRCGRRDSVVDANQVWVLETPFILDKIIMLLSIISFAPNINYLSTRKVSSQPPLCWDIINNLCLSMLPSEWKHFGNRLRLCENLNGISVSEQYQPSTISLSPPPLNEFMTELITAFSPQEGTSMTITSIIDFAIKLRIARDSIFPAGFDIRQLTSALGIDTATMSSRGALLLTEALLEINSGDRFSDTSSRNRPISQDPMAAEREIQFFSLLLFPYSIEIIFVICTLLVGKRKVAVQKQLYSKGFLVTLEKLFGVVSWVNFDFNSSNNNNSRGNGNGNGNGNGTSSDDEDEDSENDLNLELSGHAVEKAFQIQFLRLVHNFCDRDMIFNYCKSPLVHENEYEDCRLSVACLPSPLPLCSRPSSLPSFQFTGIISHVIEILKSSSKAISTQLENVDTSSHDSHRFWLSSSIESFLRGNSSVSMRLIAMKGILECELNYIFGVFKKNFEVKTHDRPSDRLFKSSVSMNQSSKKKKSVIPGSSIQCLQSSFDLMAEMLRNDPLCLDILNSCLGDLENFKKFMSIAMQRIVESNVFLRSLILALESLDFRSKTRERRRIDLLQISSQQRGKNDGECLDFRFQKRQQQPGDFVFSTLNVGSLGGEEDISHENHCLTDQEKVESVDFALPINKNSDNEFYMDRSTCLQTAYYLTHSWIPFSPRPSLKPSTMERIKSILQGRSMALSKEKMQLSQQSSKLKTSIWKSQEIITADQIREREELISKGNMSGASLSSKRSSSSHSSNHSSIGSSSSSNHRDNSSHHLPCYRLPQTVRMVSTRSVMTSQSLQPVVNTAIDQDNLSIDDSNAKNSLEKPLSLSQIEDMEPHEEDYDSYFHTDSFLIFSKKYPHFQVVSSQRWEVPSSMFRVSYYIYHEQKFIVINLISSVSLVDVNHENICILNTALFFFILAFQKGRLEQFLQDVRQVANSDAKFSIVQANTFKHVGSISSSIGESSDNASQNPVGDNQSASSTSSATQSSNDAVKIFQNFRKLLWFWKEYYVRRGRDRLSLEFWSRTPFSYWVYVVDLLSSDDDSSPYSLLKGDEKIRDFNSPYQFPPSTQSSASPFFLNY